MYSISSLFFAANQISVDFEIIGQNHRYAHSIDGKKCGLIRI